MRDRKIEKVIYNNVLSKYNTIVISVIIAIYVRFTMHFKARERKINEHSFNYWLKNFMQIGSIVAAL